MNFIYRSICWAGGGNSSVLRDLPTEQNRFFSYGTVIIMTAVFATLSSSYAFWWLLEEQLGSFVLLPALAWGAFIFVIDRFFITSIPQRGNFFNKFLIALPRLVLAVFIGVLISKPLEFRIFQREISDQLIEIKDEERDKIDSLFRLRVIKLMQDKDREVAKMTGAQELGPLQQKITELKSSFPAKEAALRAQQDSVDCECNGACGTGIKGRGPSCKFQEQIYARLLSEKNKTETDIKTAENKVQEVLSGLQTQIDKTITPKYKTKTDSLEKEQRMQREALESNYKPSILNQQIALAQIEADPEKPSARYTIWFVTLLFIFIEMAPMLLKLMTGSGAYEKRIAQIEATYSTDGRLRRTLDLEEYKSNRGLVQKLARSQRIIIQNALEAWHKEQMDRMKDDPQYFNNIFDENREQK